MNSEERQSVIEALIFACDVPLTFSRLKEIIGDITPEQFAADVKVLDNIYRESSRAFEIIEVGGGVQLSSRPEFAVWIRRMLAERLRSRLSRPALETLAITAYRQPITRSEIELIRGVDSGGVLGTLMERGLVTVSGRATTPGRPLLYATTQDFLRYFGLNEIEDLPKIRELQGLVEGDPHQVNMTFNKVAEQPSSEDKSGSPVVHESGAVEEDIQPGAV